MGDTAPAHESSGGGTTAPRPPLHVFVSYRREDTDIAAGRLYDNLTGQFEVFMDIDAIGPGEDYVKVLDDAVGSCDVLLALIGRQWLTAEDAAGRPRLESEGDWVRREIEAALDRDLRVIPVLFQDASMPSAEQLPGPLSRLASRQAHEITNERWSYDVSLLVNALERVRAEKAQRDRGDEGDGERDVEVEPGERRWAGLFRLIRSRAVVIAGAVLGVAVLAAAALWILRGDGSSFGWTDISHRLPSSQGAVVNAAITFPERRGDPYLVGGRQGSDAALWTSQDGFTWQRSVSPAFQSTDSEELEIQFLMPSSSGAIAVGEETSLSGDSNMAIWSSDDFTDWVRLDGEDLDSEGNQFARTAINAGGDVFVAGFEGSERRGRAAVARLPEGAATWERITDEDFEAGTAAAITRMVCLSPGPECGTLVAVGWSSDGGTEDAMAWTSPTGGSDDWNAHRIPAPGNQRITHAARFGSQLVAVGFDAAEDGSRTDLAVWLSSDGQRWESVSGLEGEVSQGAEVVVSPQVEDDGVPDLIAGGFRGEPGDLDAAVWTSEDGESWQPESAPGDVLGGVGDQRIVALAARRLPVIAVGEDGGGLVVWCGDCPSE